jgi:tetratricopeptide (TPR) repeat protein
MKLILTKRLIASVTLTTAFLLHVFCISNAAAEIRTIASTGEYRMGDNDTRTDAKRLALLDAKRLALEKAGTYIESVTEVKSLDLTKEEIRAYTAGIVEVIEQTTSTVMEGESTVVRVDVTAKIDTDVVTRQIEALRQNQDVKSKLLEAEFRAYKLQKELETKTQELTSAKSRAMVDALSRQRQQLMTHADVENLATRARVVLAGQKGYTLTVGSSTPESRKYARSLIEQALAYEPENTDAQALLGFVQFEEGQREAAIDTYRSIALKEPLSAQVHVNLGKVLWATGDYLNALKEYETATRLEPDHAGAHAAIGTALFFTAKIDRAIDELREATQLAPRNAEYHRDLADALYSRAGKVRLSDTRLPSEEKMADKPKGALEEAFEEWLATQEQSSVRDRDEAMTELRKAVALDPSNAVFHKALGDRLGGEEAIAEYRTAVRLNPSDVYTRVDLGTILLNNKDVKGALAEFQVAVRVDPTYAKAHLRLGEAFEESGEMDQAIDAYRKALTRLPQSPHGMHEPLIPSGIVGKLAQALKKVGKRKEAIKVYRDYLKDNPDAPYWDRERLQELEQEK